MGTLGAGTRPRFVLLKIHCCQNFYFYTWRPVVSVFSWNSPESAIDLLKVASSLMLGSSMLTEIPSIRDCLPSIGFLELEQIKKDGSRPLQKYPTMATTVGVSTAPLVSPTSIYSGPPPPYSYPSSTSSAPLQSGYISPPDSRRAVEDEKDQSHSQPQRQSLPSIHEALGNDNPLPYTGPPSSGPPSQPAHHAPPPLPANLISRSSVEGPPGPPNPFSNGSTSAPYLREPAYPYQNGQAGLSQAEASRSSLASLNSQDSRNPSLPSLSSGKSPTQSSRTGAPSLQVSQTSSAYEYSAQGSVGSMASPTTYSPYNQSFSYQSQPSSGTGSYPSAPYDSRPYTGVPWKAGAAEQHRMEEMKRSLVTRPAMPGQPHSDSVKRHLDSYDVETSLNEVRIQYGLLFRLFFPARRS